MILVTCKKAQAGRWLVLNIGMASFHELIAYTTYPPKTNLTRTPSSNTKQNKNTTPPKPTFRCHRQVFTETTNPLKPDQKINDEDFL